MPGRAEVVVACDDLQANLDFFVDRLGFRLAMITPADAPTTAVVAGHGLRLRLEAASPLPAGGGAAPPPVRIALRCDPATAADLGSQLVAPDGTIIDVVAEPRGPIVPPPAPRFELSIHDEDGFGSGRAAMAYRDLLPQRQGGRYIASHIRIAEGGPVPDYVHYHRIRFQLIYCWRGWVRVVYEDQGPPFVLEPGDCVLQPPGIRHRVLESSDGLDVIEIGSPASHDTLTDPGLSLPTPEPRPDRCYGGQRFVRHVAADAGWAPEETGALSARDLGLVGATDGLAAGRVVRPSGTGAPSLGPAAGDELHFVFVTEGHARLVGAPTGQPGAPAAGEASIVLRPGDALAFEPAGDARIGGLSADFEALEIVLPAP